MNRDAERGHLTIAGAPMPESLIARAIGADARTLKAALRELEQNGVSDRDHRGALRSKLMIRDEEERARQAANGRLGGNPALTGATPSPASRGAASSQQNRNADRSSINKIRANGVKATLFDPPTGPRAQRTPTANVQQTRSDVPNEINGLSDIGLNPSGSQPHASDAELQQDCGGEFSNISELTENLVKAPRAGCPLTDAHASTLQNCNRDISNFSELPEIGVNPESDLQITNMFAAKTLQECRSVLNEIKGLLAEGLNQTLIPRIREERKKGRKEERVLVDANDFDAAPAEQPTPADSPGDLLARDLDEPAALSADSCAAPAAARAEAAQAPPPPPTPGPAPAPAQAPSRSRANRADCGTRLPADWAPTAGHFALARSLGFAPGQLGTIAENFRDYWTARPGAGGRKLDWDGTFRVWLRRESSSRPGRRAAQPEKPPAKGDWLLKRFFPNEPPSPEPGFDFDITVEKIP